MESLFIGMESLWKLLNLWLMQPADLISVLALGSERAVADIAVTMLEKSPGSFPDVLNLCFLEQYPLSMRAARVIQLYCEKHPESICPYLELAVQKTITSNIDGVKRNFLKIFAEFIDINRLDEPGPLLNQCFEWLMDPQETPGVRIFAMEIVFLIGKNEPDLLRELRACLEILDEEKIPSLQARITLLRVKLR